MRVGRVRRRWTCTSTRASSSSSATGSPSPRVGWRRRPTKRARPQRSWAARSSSRRRCSPAGAARRAGSSSPTSPTTRETKAAQILGLDIRGHVVRKLWIERASDIAKEYYLSLTFDRGAKQPLFMFTTEGGIDIEEVAESTPEKLVRLHVDPFEGFQPWQARRLVYGAGSRTRASRSRSSSIVGKLYEAFVATDAMLTEINPLIVTPDGEVKALDSKFTVDDAALFRHPDIAEMRDLDARTARGASCAREGRHLREARRRGRDPRERRRPRDVDARRDRARRRASRQLLRPRGRRRRRGCRRRARGDHRGSAGEVDPLQRLRRDHALRRGRARDPRRRSTGCRSSIRSWCGSTGRTPRRAGGSSQEASPPNLHVEPTMLDAARRAVELAA